MKTALGILLLVAVTNAFPASKKGERYTFNYQTEVVHSIPGGASRQIGLLLQCKCHVTMVKSDETQIKLENVQLSQLQIDRGNRRTLSEIQVDKEAIQMLEKNPIELVFSQSRRVKTIRADKNEPEWVLNIKRGIANLVQVSPKSDKMETKQILTTKTPVVIDQKEQTIVGHCPVTYTVEPWVMQDKKTLQLNQVNKVTKTIQYENCADRPSLKESIAFGQLCPSCKKSLGYVSYLRHAGQIEHILKDSYLMEAKAHEQHVFTPYSELGGQVEATVRQHLWFQSAQKIQNVEIVKDPVETSLLMRIVHPEQEVRQNKKYKQGIQDMVKKLQQQLANEVKKDVSSHVIPKIVTELVAHLRLCDTDSLQQFLELTLKQQNQKVRQLCIDAMSLAGTKEFVQLLQKVLTEKKTSQIPLPLFNRILTNIVFTPEVTSQHVDTVLNLCQNVPEFQKSLEIRRQCYLSYSALVNRLSQRPDAQQRTDIQTSILTCVKHLQEKLQNAQNVDEKLCFIKAMGNAGLQQHQKLILQQLQDQKQSMVLRVECVWALRRMVSSEHRCSLTNKLIEIFHDREQHPELRMAIVELLLDRQPSFVNMQLFLNAVIRETQSKGPRSNQVASWVISKLSSMAYYDNVILKTRASRARRCLSSARQYVSKTDFGIEYSKAMRIAMYSDHLLSGLELEMNKMNVPESYLPRNMNARLMMHMMGHRFEMIQAGVRIEGVKDIIQDLVSEIHSRQKRSLWSTVWDMFSGEEENPSSQSTQRSTQQKNNPTTNPVSSSTDESSSWDDEFEDSLNPSTRATRPTAGQRSTRQSSSQRPTTRSQNEQSPKKPEVAMFMKVFGQEVKFARITPDILNQLASEITDLLLGKKSEIQTALGAIKISKDSITISQQITKAFMAVHARQLEPTIAGWPLHLHTMSTAVTHIESDVKITVQPSLWKITSAKEITASFNVRPKVSVFTYSTIQIHSPFVRVGIKAQNYMQMNPSFNWEMSGKTGNSYTFKSQLPTQRTDIFVISPDPSNPNAVGVCGVVASLKVQQFQLQEKEVELKLSQQYMNEYSKDTCYDDQITGVSVCVKGKCPNFATLRFSDVPVFPSVSMFNYRVQFVPKDQAKQAVLQFNVDQKQKSQGDIIFRTEGKKQRKIVARYNYDSQKNRLSFKVKESSGIPYLRGKTALTFEFQSLKNIKATLMHGIFQWSLQSKIIGFGRQMTVEIKWNKLPKSLRQILQRYEPQILYILQQFASISTQEQSRNSIKITFHLLSQLASNVEIESPLGKVQSKVMSLPVSVRRLPLSLKEIIQYPYSQCRVQSVQKSNQKRVSIFDQQSYSFSAPSSPCQHTLIQDQHNKLVKVSVQSQSQGQMDLIVQVQHPQKTTIVVKHDQSILINNQKLRQESYKQHGVQVSKRQQQILVTLNSRHYIQVQYQSRNIQILASPTLRNQLRGLCGDNNGESYQELRSPEGKVLRGIDEFAQSWKSQC